MAQQPDAIFASLLQGLFPTTQVGPGTIVYHEPAASDPLESYVVYSRNGTEFQKDLAGNTHLTIVSLEATVGAKFAANAFGTAIATLDQTISGGWYFDLVGQTDNVGEATDNAEPSFSVSYLFNAYLSA